MRLGVFDIAQGSDEFNARNSYAYRVEQSRINVPR